MEIGIITIHYGINYGSALQCFALSKYLDTTYPDSSISVINYIPERYRPKNRYLGSYKDKNILKKIMYLVFSAPNRFRYQVLFDRFLKKNVPLGKKVFNYTEVEKKYSEYDLLITGSDQVWNTDYNGGVDPLYYLSFGGTDTVRISYAASCGKDWFDENELEKCISLWKQFDGLSIREDVTTEALRKNGFDKTTQVLDPIFLLSENEWKKILPECEIPEPYIFIYALEGDDERAVDIAVKIAKERHLKVVMISYGHIWSRNTRVDYYLRLRSPFQFLSLLANAEYVVTNSFHGVAFSLRFRKQFVAIKRNKYNNRLDSILRLTNLENRLVENTEKIFFDDIKYSDQVDVIIKKMEKKSKDYIDTWVKYQK